MDFPHNTPCRGLLRPSGLHATLAGLKIGDIFPPPCPPGMTQHTALSCPESGVGEYALFSALPKLRPYTTSAGLRITHSQPHGSHDFSLAKNGRFSSPLLSRHQCKSGFGRTENRGFAPPPRCPLDILE